MEVSHPAESINRKNLATRSHEKGVILFFALLKITLHVRPEIAIRKRLSV